MKEISPTQMALAGGGLIAVTYGLARFVFGLFLPEIRNDLNIGATMAGFVGSLPYLGYIAAILAAPLFSRMLGVKNASAAVGLIAVAGLLTISMAQGAGALAFGAIMCGISTGLSSPILAEGVQYLVKVNRQGRVNASINAATSVGITIAALAVIWWGDDWRTPYMGFSGLAVAAVVAIMVLLPHIPRPVKAMPSITDMPPPGEMARKGKPIVRDLILLGIIPMAMGVVSAVYWLFAPDFAVNYGGLSSEQSAWIWLAVGLGGLVGIFAGDLLDRYGMAISHLLALSSLSAAILLLAIAPGNIITAVISATVFGAAYMILTGLYLVASVRTTPKHPSIGPVIPLIGASTGQVIGSSTAGWAISQYGHETTFVVFTTVGLCFALLSLALPSMGQTSRESRTEEN